jgi:hypothetical protein
LPPARANQPKHTRGLDSSDSFTSKHRRMSHFGACATFGDNRARNLDNSKQIFDCMSRHNLLILALHEKPHGMAYVTCAGKLPGKLLAASDTEDLNADAMRASLLGALRPCPLGWARMCCSNLSALRGIFASAVVVVGGAASAGTNASLSGNRYCKWSEIPGESKDGQ